MALVPVGKDATAAFAKEKKNTAIIPDHQIVRWESATVNESRILVRVKGGVREGALGDSRGLHGEGSGF